MKYMPMVGLQAASRNTSMDRTQEHSMSIAPSYINLPEADSASGDEAPLDFSIRRSISQDSNNDIAENPASLAQPVYSMATVVKQEEVELSRSSVIIPSEVSSGYLLRASQSQPGIVLPQVVPDNRAVLSGLPVSAPLLPNALLGSLAMQAQSQQPLFNLLQSTQFQAQFQAQLAAAGQVTHVDQSSDVKASKRKSAKRAEVARLPPIAPFPANLPEVAAMNACSQEAYKKFRELMAVSREVALSQSEEVSAKSRTHLHSESASPESSQGSMSPLAASGSDGVTAFAGGGGGGAVSTTSVTSTSGNKLKRAASVGSSGQTGLDDSKDDAYWERRRRNNDAAKRSRDARRQKEDEIAVRAAFLEQENVRLRIEVAALRTETARLRLMLHDQSSDGHTDLDVGQ